ncbi:hypothetical protein LXL04_032950 [Taraxacum kok-saghyz]
MSALHIKIRAFLVFLGLTNEKEVKLDHDYISGSATACELNFARSRRRDPCPFDEYSVSLGSNVTELWLGGLITEESSLEMINSRFPFLESLTIDLGCWTLEFFHFTCVPLKKLSLVGKPPLRLVVYAPKLLDFLFVGPTKTINYFL